MSAPKPANHEQTPSDIYNVILRVAEEIRKAPKGEFAQQVKKLKSQDEVVALYRQHFSVRSQQS
jgi:hypothetical protein